MYREVGDLGKPGLVYVRVCLGGCCPSCDEGFPQALSNAVTL